MGGKVTVGLLAAMMIAIAVPATGQQILTSEQMAALDIDVETIQIGLACDYDRNHAALTELVKASGARETGGAASDYVAMRREKEQSVRQRTRPAEYCATGWWKYGSNGTVVAGLLSRPPPIEEQPPLTAEQEATLASHAAASVTGAYCSEYRSNNDAQFDAVRLAGIDRAFRKGTRSLAFVQDQQETEISRMQEIGRDAYCADGWGRFGADGTEVPELLMRRD